MDIPEQIIEVDGIPVRCFISHNDTIAAYILPDSRVEHWKSRMNAVKAERGEHVYTESDILELRKRGFS